MIPDTEIRFPCPACQQPLTADARAIGRPARCTGCAAKIVVPPPADGPLTQFVEVKPVLSTDTVA